MKTTIIFFMYVIILFFSVDTHGQTLGDYRSRQTGNWNVATSWEYYNGTTWVNAAASPTSSGGAIAIRSSHIITVTATVTVDQLTVSAGSQLIHNNGMLNVANGAGADLTVYGTLQLNAAVTLAANSVMNLYGNVEKNTGGFTINAGATVNIENNGWFKKVGGGMTVTANRWVVKNGGTFEHADNGTNLPLADWQTNSTCIISGTINATVGNLDQSFFHFTWNSPAQTVKRNLGNNLTTILGNFNVISTGAGGIQFTNGSNLSTTIAGNLNLSGGVLSIAESGDWTVNIGGDYVQTGGTLLMTDRTSSTASGEPTLNIVGNMLIANGTFDMSQYTGSNVNMGKTLINVAGDLQIGAGGLLTCTAASTGQGTVNFNGTSMQTFSKAGIVSNRIDFIVQAGAALNMDDQVMTGTGNFTLAANATLYIGSPQGITTVGAMGNIQATGTRTYSTDASYYYDGAAAQVTGNGLPSTVKDLGIDNSNGVMASTGYTIKNLLALTNGSLNTNGNNLTLGTSTTSTGILNCVTGNIDGSFQRWISNTIQSYLYPIVRSGNDKQTTVTFTTAPASGGTITLQYILAAPGNNGFPLSEQSVTLDNSTGDGYWNFSTANGFSGGTYALDVNAGGIAGLDDPVSLRVIRRANAGGAWSFVGSHSPGTIANGIVTGHRTGLTSLLQFGITGGTTLLPVRLVRFNGQVKNNKVELQWIVEWESGNDYYTVERSHDGINFQTIDTIHSKSGSGSRVVYHYTDRQSPAKERYYRLKQTDIDGRFEIFKVINVPAGAETDFTIEKIWSAPGSQDIYVKVSSGTVASVSIELVSPNGILLYKSSHSKTQRHEIFRLNAGLHLPAGIYFVRIVAENYITSGKILLR